MIVNVRGTSGSGKSTLVRKIMDLYETRCKVHVDGRKQPIGYELFVPHHRPLFVVGHYETACGGCDTIAHKAFDTAYKLVRDYHARHYDVLFEGLLISAEANRLLKLHEDFPGHVVVVNLQTPLDDCMEGIRQRRAAKGNTKPFGANFEKNLRSKRRGAEQCCKRFGEAGVPVFHCMRDDAEALIQETLEL